MKYWISFSVFQTVEYFADLTVAYVMPFYLETKILTLMWLVHMRASSLIDLAIDKELKKREKIIDKCIARCLNDYAGPGLFQVARLVIKIMATIFNHNSAFNREEEEMMHISEID